MRLTIIPQLSHEEYLIRVFVFSLIPPRESLYTSKNELVPRDTFYGLHIYARGMQLFYLRVLLELHR